MLSIMEGSSSSTNNGRKCHRDRISNLPNAILGSILSYIPTTKEAVRTSVLSKQWRYVWTSVPHISIDDTNLFLSKEIILQSNRKIPEAKGRFVDFVDRVLGLNNVSPLQNFELICHQHYGQFFAWISFLTSRREVEELHLQKVALSESEQRIEFLPPCLFTCKNLVILKLRNQFVLDVPISVCLPSLKILHLVLVQFLYDDCMANLLAGCPVLQELIYERDYHEKTKTLYIQSSSLKRLRLDIEESSDDNLSFVLDAKNLEQLDICDQTTLQFYVKSPSSLVSVQLDLFCENFGREDIYIELLSKLCSTKCLKLSVLTLSSLRYQTLANLPIFHYLTHLMVLFVDDSWPVLPYLLESAPNLITFDFTLDESTDDLDEVTFRCPKCLMLHLESINITGFDWSQNQLEMLKYFLKNSMVLKKLLICGADEESDLYKELCMLPMSSTACEIQILSYKSCVEIGVSSYHGARDSDAWESSSS